MDIHSWMANTNAATLEAQPFSEPGSNRWQHVPRTRLDIRLPNLEGLARGNAARFLEAYVSQPARQRAPSTTGNRLGDTTAGNQLRDSMVQIRHEISQQTPVHAARLLQLVALGLSAADDLCPQSRDREAVTEKGNRTLRRALDGRRTGVHGLRQRLPDFLPQRLRGTPATATLPPARELLPVLKDWIHSIPYWNGLDDGQVRKNLSRLVAAVTNDTPGSSLPTFRQGDLMGLIARAGHHVPQAIDAVLDWLAVAGRRRPGGLDSLDVRHPSAIVGLAHELPSMSTDQAMKTLGFIEQMRTRFFPADGQTLRDLVRAARTDAGARNLPALVTAFDHAWVDLNQRFPGPIDNSLQEGGGRDSDGGSINSMRVIGQGSASGASVGTRTSFDEPPPPYDPLQLPGYEEPTPDELR